MMVLTDDEPEVKMDVFGLVTTRVNSALLLITPNCLINFEEIKNRLMELSLNYQKENAIHFI
jgi:hypothetical protein